MFKLNEGDGGGHLRGKLAGSGLVVELTGVRSIVEILSSVVGLSQVCLSWDIPQDKVKV